VCARRLRYTGQAARVKPLGGRAPRSGIQDPGLPSGLRRSRLTRRQTQRLISPKADKLAKMCLVTARTMLDGVDFGQGLEGEGARPDSRADGRGDPSVPNASDWAGARAVVSHARVSWPESRRPPGDRRHRSRTAREVDASRNESQRSGDHGDDYCGSRRCGPGINSCARMARCNARSDGRAQGGIVLQLSQSDSRGGSQGRRERVETACGVTDPGNKWRSICSVWYR